MAPLPWLLGYSLQRRQPSHLPLPFRVGGGWAAKVGHPFSSLRWLSPGCWVPVLRLGSAYLAGGVCLFVPSGASRLLEPNPRCGPSWCDSSFIFIRDSPPPRYRCRRAGCLSSVSGLVPTDLGGTVPVCLGNHSWSGSRFFIHLFLLEWCRSPVLPWSALLIWTSLFCILCFS